MIAGEAGADYRGVWILDDDTGTHFRAGEVGYEMAMALTEQGNHSAAREAISRPHVGISITKTF